MRRVSCILPAYNEARRIGGVLSAVLGHPLVQEVLVVDDGSRDGTSAVARAAGARVIALPQNGGKTRALLEGIAAAEGEFLLFLDGDLLGLDAAAVTALLAPVIEGRAEVAISLRGNAPRTWRLIGLDYISGERVMPRVMLRGREEAMRALPRFGVEVFLNRLWIGAGARVAVVRWPGVRSPSKGSKLGRWRGLAADLGMMRDIFATIRPWQALAQIVRLQRLAVARVDLA